jgi:AraC-like DNA-binding protein
MRIVRSPRPSLRPFVSLVWAVDERSIRLPEAIGRENVLPTGSMHLVFRLAGEALRLYDGPCDDGSSVGLAVVGGARSTYYTREVSTPSFSVGALLRPGASELLFDATAVELSERHTRLEDLWGSAAEVAQERLFEAGALLNRLAILESLLAQRLPVVRGLHPAIAQALEQLDGSASVRDVVDESGYSHRHFIALFRRTVGLAPKVYSRVLRFQRALRRAASGSPDPWASMALDAGYSDQAHFNRDFLEFSGLTPTAYREAAPRFPNHVRVR